jgi:hypothetical protein
MKWVARAIAILVTPVATALPLSFLGLFVGSGFEGLGYALFLLLFVPSGWAACILVAIPGLVILDRQGTGGRRSSLALGTIVGLVAGEGAWIMFALTFGENRALWESLPILVYTVPSGAVLGVLGTGVFWYVDGTIRGWLVQTREQLRHEASLRRMDADEREALRSRRDR